MNLLVALLIHLPLLILAAPIISSSSQEALNYYTRENCETLGLLPKWHDDYTPSTHFESLFKSPLSIDLIASAHSGNETGFEQITANWGCDFESCYGTGESGMGCESIGFYGPGAKDPAGGGCPRGPVKVYEELTCAIKLGLKSDPKSFESFCGVGDEKMGMFECISFFANVLTETGSFAETEERDPRPYCWNRADGNSDCCPAADHKPCMPDSDGELSSSSYPKPNTLWLTNQEEEGKCCTYHGRGFLQVSYEPNYKAMSKALLNDEKVLWHYPYKLKSDGVMGWSAALWFWFNEHPAQINNGGEAGPPPDMENVSPRSELFKWQDGKGFPGTINVINGGECSGEMETFKSMSRVSYFFAIAHRMGAQPPTMSGETELSYYPLPGTSECQSNTWCRQQFHNNNSVCPIFRGQLDCTTTPYLVNASTPMGFWRITMKMTQADGKSPICQIRAKSGATPVLWKVPQESFTPTDLWWEMLDIHRENVCSYVKLFHPSVEGTNEDFIEGESKYCTTMCYKDFAWDVTLHGQQCDEPQQPCKTLAEYVSHPLPKDGWETGHMGGYQGGPYLGRVGPGLVMALNGDHGFKDKKDELCYHFGGSACHWNVAMGCKAKDNVNIHGCRVFPPSIPESTVLDTLVEGDHELPQLETPEERPAGMKEVLAYYNDTNCPPATGKTVLEQLFPNGAQDFDFLFSSHYSQNDGFANQRYDVDDERVNKNSILYGYGGPKHVWNKMLCAFQLGVPSDPDYFQKYFGLRRTVKSRAEVPFPLSEDEKRFAQLEFIAMAANMIKETGALGQAEEQDPRCYCNYQGGKANPCCPNEWGNNPPCFTTTDSTNPLIPQEEMDRGLTTHATCCSYHGRGYLQTSYEKNYGDLGAFMLEDETKGVDEEMGRKFLLNYPQTIDAFGVTGWTSTFSFWIHPHPCQYCEGRNTTTVDWNAKEYSPHDAIVNYDKPGQGLGMTFTIINGIECESDLRDPKDIADHGGQMRLSLFYNLAHRMQVKAPGETMILPLPGTKECDASPFCQGTFFESPEPIANYRAHSGGCWALTPQPVSGDNEIWPFCTPYAYQKGSSKWGANMDLLSFSLKETDTKCEMLHEFRCGAKIINKFNKPSMFTEPKLMAYTEDHQITTDYEDPAFVALMGMGPDVLCQYAVDTDPTNPYPVGEQNCEWWCRQPSGAGQCAAMDTETCSISATGSNFVNCANKVFKQSVITSDCQLKVPSDIDGNNPPPAVTTTLRPPSVCELCSDCVSTDGWNDSACKVCIGNANGHNVWPCHQPGYCKCVGDAIEPEEPAPSASCGDESCDNCVAASGQPWDDTHCLKCSNGQNKNEWPCSAAGFCKCVGDSIKQASSSFKQQAAPPSSPTTSPCDESCKECIGSSGEKWHDTHCQKCERGQFNNQFPCDEPGFCKCRSASSSSPPRAHDHHDHHHHSNGSSQQRFLGNTGCKACTN